MKLRLIPIVAVITALTLSGCAGQGATPDDPWAGIRGGGGGGSTPGNNGGNEAPGTDAEPAPEQPALSPGAASQACLTGSWQMDNSSFERMLQNLLAAAPDVPAEFQGRSTIKVVGKSSMKFDGNGAYTGWQEGFGMVFDGGDMTITHSQDARDEGGYGANERHVWVTGIKNISLKATMDMGSLGKVDLDSSSPGMATVDVFGYQGVVPGVDFSERVDGYADYSCAGNSLTLSVDGFGEARFARVG